MKSCKLFFIFLLSAIGCHLNAQILATQESAQKSIKAIMNCSSYEINDQEYQGDIEITWLQTKDKQIIISISGVNIKYNINANDYRKSENNEAMEKQIVLHNTEDSIASPKFIYNNSVGSGGKVNAVFIISDPASNNNYCFTIDKCVFINKDGQSYNYYCDRTNSLESDLMYYFFRSRKIKNESSVFSSFLKKVKKK